MKKSFMLHIDSLSVLNKLSKEQAGELFMAIRAYHEGESIELSPMIDIVFEPFKNQFMRDDKSYENICKRNADNGKKGGRPKNPENPVGYLETQKTQTNPTEPKKADSKKDKDSKKDNKKIDTLLEFWNGLTVPQARFKNKNCKVGDRIMMQCRGSTPLLAETINKACKTYKSAEIEQAIKNYANDILKRDPDQSYSTHRFSIKEFLTQKNAIHEYVLR